MLRYLRRNKSLAVGIVLLSLLALFIIIGNLTVDTERRPPAVGARAAAAVVGVSVRHRPPGP